jgi:hypothetical protein
MSSRGDCSMGRIESRLRRQVGAPHVGVALADNRVRLFVELCGNGFNRSLQYVVNGVADFARH